MKRKDRAFKWHPWKVHKAVRFGATTPKKPKNEVFKPAVTFGTLGRNFRDIQLGIIQFWYFVNEIDPSLTKFVYIIVFLENQINCSIKIQ